MGKKIMMILLLVLGTLCFLQFRNELVNFNFWDKDNWRWNDDWNGNGPTKKNIDNKQNIVDKNNLVEPKTNIVADNYTDALDLSAKNGKPVLVFYTADWCVYCQKMKSETLPSVEVNEMLKNYILVYINTDIDRSGIKKFNVENLPSFVITNYKEEKIKSNKGFMDKKSFVNWLNDPILFKQPIK